MLMVVLIILPLTFLSCKSIKEIPIHITDTLYNTKTNTEYIKDSVYITQYQKNDTIYIDKLKYKYINTNKTDTIKDIRYIDKPIYIEVEKTKYPKEYIYLLICSILSLLYVGYKIKSKLRLFN